MKPVVGLKKEEGIEEDQPSSSPVPSSTVTTTGIRVTETGSCPKKNGTTKKAATAPSPSSSVQTWSEGTAEAEATTTTTAMTMTTASPSPAGAATAAEPPPPPASSSFGFKRGFLNNNSSSTSSSSSVRSATTTTATVAPPSTIQSTRTSTNEDDTTDETEPAEALQPSMLDPQEECVLCAYPLPLDGAESNYQSCCGETICNGCIIAQQRVHIIGTNVEKPIKGSKAEEREFMEILLSGGYVCPFCRAKLARGAKEAMKRVWKQIDDNNDPDAMNMLGKYYEEGMHGLSKNPTKAEELYQRAYDLGHPDAARNLGVYYTNHISNPVLATKYQEEGARRGNAHCMAIMGCNAHQSHNYEEASRLWMTAARLGDDDAMKRVMVSYQRGYISKEDLATTRRAHKAANDAGKNEPREYAKRHKIFEDTKFEVFLEEHREEGFEHPYWYS